MGSAPRISIGMPVYNGEPFIEQALNSILGQTFEDFELIISDNASTDSTEAICRAYAANDKRIRYYHNEMNLGAAFNYNRVFELASGEYFKWAAADDLCAPELLAKCLQVLNRKPEVILCYPKTDIIDEHGKVIKPYERSLDLRSASAVDRFREGLRDLGECNAVFGLIRSDTLRRTRLIGNYSGSDTVLLMELSLYGQFTELTQRLFFRREHAGASSCNKSIENTQEFFDPKTKGKVCMPRWRHFVQHVANVTRAPLNLGEKLRLLPLVLRYGIGSRRFLVREPLQAIRLILRTPFRSSGFSTKEIS